MLRTLFTDHSSPTRSSELLQVSQHPNVDVEDLLAGSGIGRLRCEAVVHGEDGSVEVSGPLVEIVKVRLRRLSHPAPAVQVEDDGVPRLGFFLRLARPGRAGPRLASPGCRESRGRVVSYEPRPEGGLF